MDEASKPMVDKSAGRWPLDRDDTAPTDLSPMAVEARRRTGDLSTRGDSTRDAAGLPADSRGAATAPVPPTVATGRNPLAQMHTLIEKSGEEPFPDAIIDILAEPIDDSLVDVRPDGLIFVSHPHYRDRLDRAFGPGGWVLIPLDKPAIKDNRVVYWGFLKARGQYIGDAVGGAQYYPNNAQGSYDNSVEEAKSDFVVR